QDYHTWGIPARDNQPYSSSDGLGPYRRKNLFGMQPFYMAFERDYKAHGVLIFNSNPQDITVGPAPHLIYRTIGGMLDIYFFPGPTPEDVIRQYTALVGRPALPAYWELGFQMSNSGWQNLTAMQNIVNDFNRLNIPLDVVYADIETMDSYEDFTIGYVNFAIVLYAFLISICYHSIIIL
ncbi:unnamed protein product, partial [Anisakis simplex]|uniref:Sucrase-isomaltase, intestinal n=1 Tax=Anisakis simplex TaxID=6269 RepID=A0A0M3JD30_ANISI